MSARVEVEDIETTNGEKLLAAVLALFLLIGGLWAYQEIDDRVRDAIPVDYRGTPSEQAAIARAEAAQAALVRAEEDRAAALENLELRREEYRTALDAGQRAPALARAYRDAQREFAQANGRLRETERSALAAEGAAAAANERIAAEVERRENRRELVTLLLRLLLVVSAVALGYWLLGHLRRRGSRYYPLAFSFVAFAAVLALVMGGDYVTDYIDPLDLGPFILSLVGIAATLLAFAALQRYLARRLPARRVRNRECPFCGYPVRDNAHCEGCGREVVAACARCSGDRRVGTLHCGACGAA